MTRGPLSWRTRLFLYAVIPPMLAFLMMSALSPSLVMARPSRPLAYVSSGEIWVSNATGGSARKLTSTHGRVSDISWLPDGKRILYALNASTAAERDTLNLLTVSSKTHKRLGLKIPKTRFSAGGKTWIQSWLVDDITSADVSPDGKSVVVSAYGYSEDTMGFRVMVFNLKSGSGTALKYYHRLGEWADNSGYDMVETGWAGNHRVWITQSKGDGLRCLTVSRNGGTTTRIASVSGECSSPAWSPDSKWIAWNHHYADIGPRGSYFRIGSSSGRTSKIVARGTKIGEVGLVRPSWSSEGTYIYTVTANGLWRISKDGRDVRRVCSSATAVSAWKRTR